MWWTWQPPGTALAKWGYGVPRWRWLLASPSWIQQDGTAHSLHVWHRVLSLIAIGAWLAMIFLGVTGLYAN